MTRTLSLVAVFAIAFSLNAIARAATITSPSQLTPGYTTIDFETLPNPSSYPGAGNLTIGDATFVSEVGAGVSIGSMLFSFPGADPSGNVLIPNTSSFAGDEPLRINFANPLSEILLTWVDPNFSGNRIDAYDSSDTLIETALVPATGSGTSTFVGIQRATFDISYVRITAVSSDIYLIDNVRYNAAPAVPEPSSVVLMAVSLLGVGSLAWRRQRRRA